MLFPRLWVIFSQANVDEDSDKGRTASPAGLRCSLCSSLLGIFVQQILAVFSEPQGSFPFPLPQPGKAPGAELNQPQDSRESLSCTACHTHGVQLYSCLKVEGLFSLYDDWKWKPTEVTTANCLEYILSDHIIL